MKRFIMLEATSEKKLVEGVVFTDGRVVVRWVNEPSSIVIWSSMKDFLAISGSTGDRLTEWQD